MGQLYHAQAVLIPLGIVAGWRRRAWRLPLLTAGWVVASVILVALTEPNLPGLGHAWGYRAWAPGSYGLAWHRCSVPECFS